MERKPVPIVNAQDWLTRFAKALRPLFLDKGYRIPGNITASVGHSETKRWWGSAYAKEATHKDDMYNIFISPYLNDPVEVGATLVHEMVHVVVGLREGHKKKFRECAEAVGLTGKMTTTVPGPELQAHLRLLIDDVLGPYPYSAIKRPPPKIRVKKEPQPMLVKVECMFCDGYAMIPEGMTPPLCGDEACEDYEKPMQEST